MHSCNLLPGNGVAGASGRVGSPAPRGAPLLPAVPRTCTAPRVSRHHHNTRQPVPVCKAEAETATTTTEAAEAEVDTSGTFSAGGIASGIRLEGITKTFKNQVVLDGVSWSCQKGERVGLVGVNGAGKTTQLQIITGRLEADGGEVVKAKANMKIAYLNQEFDVDPTRTVREEFASAYGEAMAVIKRTEEVQQELEEVGEDMDKMAELLDELNDLSMESVDVDVALIDKEIDIMMPQLGFKPEDNDRLVASFSGGWQMRMCLGKILLSEPDLLLLDEPTNHLDLDAIEWLEKYLKGRDDIPIVIVSHDREFLDQLCTKIVETERGVATTYKGNYTEYTIKKAENLAQQWQTFEKQQKEIKRQEDMVARLAGGGQSGRAGAAEKTIERLKAEAVAKPFEPKKRSFNFPPVERMGEVAVSIDGLTHGYGGRTLFQEVDLEINKGERIAIIGPNGAGKSTLLRLIMGTEDADDGNVRLGPHNIRPNYFEQNQAEALDLNLNALQTLEKAAPDARADQIKALLGRMMFTGKAMEKKVKVMSGGEKARLALAKFMLTEGTLLVLDEPTNHLDIPSKEMLEEAVRAFEGSVIAVSHDRYFLKKIATRVINVEDSQLTDYVGDYEYFVEQNEDEAEKMEEKQAKEEEIRKSNIKAKSKVSKAEKARLKKEKAKNFAAGGKKGKAQKNNKRWN